MKSHRLRLAIMTVTAALTAGALVGCGSAKTYQPLTAANFGTAIANATKDRPAAHMVSKSGAIVTTIDFDAGSVPKWTLTVTSDTIKKPISMTRIGNDFYVKYPGTTYDKWYKYDATKAGMTEDSIKDMFNPVELITLFNKGVQNVTYSGVTTLDAARKEKVHNYEVTLTVSKLLEALGQNSGTATLGGDSTIKEQVYLNEDNSLRRFVINMPGGVGTTTIDVTHWGQTTPINPPPSSEVTPGPSPTVKSR